MSPLSACGRGPALEAWERATTAEVLPQRTGNREPFNSAWIQLNWYPFRNHGKQLDLPNKERKFAEWFPVGSRSMGFEQWERRETILMCKLDQNRGFDQVCLTLLLDGTDLTVLIVRLTNKLLTEIGCIQTHWETSFHHQRCPWAKSLSLAGRRSESWWWVGYYEDRSKEH